MLNFFRASYKLYLEVTFRIQDCPAINWTKNTQSRWCKRNIPEEDKNCVWPPRSCIPWTLVLVRGLFGLFSEYVTPALWRGNRPNIHATSYREIQTDDSSLAIRKLDYVPEGPDQIYRKCRVIFANRSGVQTATGSRKIFVRISWSPERLRSCCNEISWISVWYANLSHCKWISPPVEILVAYFDSIKDVFNLHEKCGYRAMNYSVECCFRF